MTLCVCVGDVINDGFRLWLTSEPHPKFSAILAESSLKVTFESPPGVKRNMQRTLAAWSSGNVLKSDRGTVVKSHATFVLAWFHAIIQERRTFIPQVGNQ